MLVEGMGTTNSRGPKGRDEAAHGSRLTLTNMNSSGALVSVFHVLVFQMICKAARLRYWDTHIDDLIIGYVLCKTQCYCYPLFQNEKPSLPQTWGYLLQKNARKNRQRNEIISRPTQGTGLVGRLRSAPIVLIIVVVVVFVVVFVVAA